MFNQGAVIAYLFITRQIAEFILILSSLSQKYIEATLKQVIGLYIEYLLTYLHEYFCAMNLASFTASLKVSSEGQDLSFLIKT